MSPISSVPRVTAPGRTTYQATAWSDLKASLFPVDPSGFPATCEAIAVALHCFLRGFTAEDIAAALAFLRLHDTLQTCPVFVGKRRDEWDCNAILRRHRERITAGGYADEVETY